MNLQETTQLLAKVQAYDNRHVESMTVAAWHEALSGTALPDALLAVADHFRESTEYLRPADVIARVKAAKRDARAALSNDTSPMCPKHPEVHAWACRPCAPRRDGPAHTWASLLADGAAMRGRR